MQEELQLLRSENAALQAAVMQAQEAMREFQQEIWNLQAMWQEGNAEARTARAAANSVLATAQAEYDALAARATAAEQALAEHSKLDGGTDGQRRQLEVCILRWADSSLLYSVLTS